MSLLTKSESTTFETAVKVTANAITASTTYEFTMTDSGWKYGILVTTSSANTTITVKAGDGPSAANDLTVLLADTGSDYIIPIESGKYKNLAPITISNVAYLDVVKVSSDKNCSIAIIKLP